MASGLEVASPTRRAPFRFVPTQVQQRPVVPERPDRSFTSCEESRLAPTASVEIATVWEVES
jgi:hypothetical protein